jgi:hypothetical protein
MENLVPFFNRSQNKSISMLVGSSKRRTQSGGNVRAEALLSKNFQHPTQFHKCGKQKWCSSSNPNHGLRRRARNSHQSVLIPESI